MLPQILPLEDEEIAQVLARTFKKRGIALHVDTKVETIEVHKKHVALELAQAEKRIPLKAESLLLATGMEANTEGLFSAKVKPSLDRGYLKVDDHYQTSIKGIYAAGDVIGPPWLAHGGDL